MPIRKFTNGRFSLKRFTAPGVGGGGAAAAPAVPVTIIQAFTSSSTWKVPQTVTSVDYLVIGGGGGGGGGYQAGGGGAGGLLQGTNLSVTSDFPYTIVVGAGGAGGAAP